MSNFALHTSASPVTFTLPPPPPDGESAWRSVALTVESAVRGVTIPVTSDVQKSAETAVRVVGELRADAALYGELKKAAAAGLFDLAVLERIARLAPALWYARHQQLVEELAPGHVVGPSTVDEAQALRKRMGKVARYQLEDHKDEAPIARSLKFTQSRRRLANHLLAAAGLYERNDDVVRPDRNFRPDDAKRARDLAAEIQQALGKKGAVRWVDRCAVLWTMLKPEYDELRATGRWLLRKRPEEAKARFPALVEQPSGARRKAEEPAAPAEPPTPAAKPAAPAEKPEAPAAPAAAKPAEAPAEKPGVSAPVAEAEATKPRKALVRKTVRAPKAEAPTKRAKGRR